MRAEGSSPNLINGVSRQPAEVRLPSQLYSSVNQFPTVTRGLVPRNPATFVARNSEFSLHPDTKYHIIDRDPTERYVVRISPNGVDVTTADGQPRTVTAPNGYWYLTGITNKDQYRVLTVADYTFIVNRNKVVVPSAAKSPLRDPEALIHVSGGAYSTTYELRINGTRIAAYVTPSSGPYLNQDEVQNAERACLPGNIAYALYHGVQHPSIVMSIEGAPAVSGPGVRHLGGLYKFELIDNVIFVSHPTDFTIVGTASGRETFMRIHKGEVESLALLPRNCRLDFVIKVAGSSDTDFDDYWVQFKRDGKNAGGVWKEWMQPDISRGLNSLTMPHVLIRNADGTFTFTVGPWALRGVGDDQTNPYPSFNNKKIREVGFYKNRLGLASGENMVWSRVGDHFNMWRSTVLARVDTDPIDQAVAALDVSDINFVTSVSGQCILFTNSTPFRVTSGDVFSNSTAAYVPTLSNHTSPSVAPVAAGNKLFFINEMNSGTFVHEYANFEEDTISDAPCINEHVLGYIPGGVKMMDADEDLKMLVLQSDYEPNAIYVYKWLWIGNEKAQSAWQKWTLPNPIVALKFLDERLFLVTKEGANVLEYLEINCHEAWMGGARHLNFSPVFLDRAVYLSGTYNGTTTTFTLPYPATSDLIGVMATNAYAGSQPPILSRVGNQVVVDGFAAIMHFGVPFQSYGVLSEPVLRAKGGEGNAIPGYNLTIGTLYMNFVETSYVTIEVARRYRPEYVQHLSAGATGTETGLIGVVPKGPIRKATSIRSASADHFVKFGNNSGPYPYAVTGYRWVGEARPSNL